MSVSSSEHTEFSDAIESGNLELVKNHIQLHPELVNHPDWTPPPLHCAVLWGQHEVAAILLDNGADIEMLDPDRKTTPLRYAIMFCKVELLPLLISRGANTGPIVKDGTTAFELATNAANGKFEEFDDLPRRQEYKRVVTALQQAGIQE